MGGWWYLCWFVNEKGSASPTPQCLYKQSRTKISQNSSHRSEQHTIFGFGEVQQLKHQTTPISSSTTLPYTTISMSNNNNNNNNNSTSSSNRFCTPQKQQERRGDVVKENKRYRTPMAPLAKLRLATISFAPIDKVALPEWDDDEATPLDTELSSFRLRPRRSLFLSAKKHQQRTTTSASTSATAARTTQTSNGCETPEVVSSLESAFFSSFQLDCGK